jgi:hypothetical protein
MWGSHFPKSDPIWALTKTMNMQQASMPLHRCHPHAQSPVTGSWRRSGPGSRQSNPYAVLHGSALQLRGGDISSLACPGLTTAAAPTDTAASVQRYRRYMRCMRYSFSNFHQSMPSSDSDISAASHGRCRRLAAYLPTYPPPHMQVNMTTDLASNQGCSRQIRPRRSTS